MGFLNAIIAFAMITFVSSLAPKSVLIVQNKGGGTSLMSTTPIRTLHAFCRQPSARSFIIDYSWKRYVVVLQYVTRTRRGWIFLSEEFGQREACGDNPPGFFSWYECAAFLRILKGMHHRIADPWCFMIMYHPWPIGLLLNTRRRFDQISLSSCQDILIDRG